MSTAAEIATRTEIAPHKARNRTRAMDDNLLQAVRRELVRAGEQGATSREIATALGVLDDPQPRRAVTSYLCQMDDATKIGQRRGDFVWAIGVKLRPGLVAEQGAMGRQRYQDWHCRHPGEVAVTFRGGG